MKACSLSPRSHNLNINMYSFKELLDLFQLDYKMSIDDMKRAKMMVLKMHPDKSRLPPDYFLFYKKAFDMIVQYYNDSVKINTEVPTEEQVYKTQVKYWERITQKLYSPGLTNDQAQQLFVCAIILKT